MNDPRPRRRFTVKTRVLLAAAAGATVLSMVGCGSMPVGNLLPPCGVDGGPKGCAVFSVDDGKDAGASVDAGAVIGGDR